MTEDEVRGWRLGAPFGVPVHLSSSWPLLALFMVVYFGPQVAEAVPGLGAVAYAVAGVYAVLLMLSVLAHEAAHAAAARATGARVGRIVLDLFGGHTTYDAAGTTPVRSALIAVVGPVANGLLAAVGYVLLPWLPPGVPWLLGAAFVFSNAAVAVFNLLPGHPLDGGHVLDAVIWRVTGRRELGLLVSGWAGRVLVVAFVGWFVVLPLVRGGRPSFFMLAWAALVGAMLWSGAGQAIRAGRHLGAYARITMADVVRPVVVVPGETPLREARAAGAGTADTARTVVLVSAHGQLGLLTAPPDLGAADLDHLTADSVTVRPPSGWLLEADGTTSVAEVVDRMHETGSPLVVLTRQGRPVGAVTSTAVHDALG